MIFFQNGESCLTSRKKSIDSIWYIEESSKVYRRIPQGEWQQSLTVRCICRWFDLVVVLQTDNSLLYDRLQKR